MGNRFAYNVAMSTALYTTIGFALAMSPAYRYLPSPWNIVCAVTFLGLSAYFLLKAKKYDPTGWERLKQNVPFSARIAIFLPFAFLTIIGTYVVVFKYRPPDWFAMPTFVFVIASWLWALFRIRKARRKL